MNAVDGSEHYGRSTDEQTPSLLTVILDTNPAAWNLLDGDLSLSDAISDLLILINAHLAFNYANKVAVLASHCSTAKWLYPTPSVQADPPSNQGSKRKISQSLPAQNGDSGSSKKLKADVSSQATTKIKLKLKDPNTLSNDSNSSKYRPFRMVEEEVIRNLTSLLSSTTASEVEDTSSTMIAGALTLALSNINRERIAYAEDTGGGGNRANATDPNTQPNIPSASTPSALQCRIFLLSVSPTTDLAHQYIPIMNSIFACQRLSIPIDICQIPLPPSTTTTSSTNNITPATTSTVFLQQASDATHGIYIPLPPLSQNGAHHTLLPYLLTAYLPSNTSRTHLILPTRIDVDFRAACFCHRRVVDIGFVCSICLSIFCSVPGVDGDERGGDKGKEGECLTCGTRLKLGEYGNRPVVVAAKGKGKKKKKVGGFGTGASTPTPGPS